MWLIRVKQGYSDYAPKRPWIVGNPCTGEPRRFESRQQAQTYCKLSRFKSFELIGE